MDLRQLRYFAAVAETGHVSRAAEKLGIQQPPLSQQLKAFEMQLGLQLFRRHARGVTLTEGGKVLLADARRILTDVASLERRMMRAGSGLQGRLAVAFTSSAAAHQFTPVVLRACRHQYPDIELSLGEDNAAGIIDALAAGRIDCGLLRLPTAHPDGVVFETLLNEPMLVALPVGHRLLAGKRGRNAPRLKLADLRDEGVILVRRPGAPGMYANFLALCRKTGFDVRVIAEVERMMTNLNLVAAGAGISVVPASMRGIHAHAIVYCPLAGAESLQAPLTLAYREGELAGVLSSFVALAHEVARRPQPA